MVLVQSLRGEGALEVKGIGWFMSSAMPHDGHKVLSPKALILRRKRPVEKIKGVKRINVRKRLNNLSPAHVVEMTMRRVDAF